MELLLNFAWLLLALPAYWLWLDARDAATGRRLTALQYLFSLACVLVLLFPIISATDDLRAMRADMEESPHKISICQKSTDKHYFGKWQSQPALASFSSSQIPTNQAWPVAPTSAFSLPPAPTVAAPSRAPPQLPLA
jgi:hypothetical protein